MDEGNVKGRNLENTEERASRLLVAVEPMAIGTYHPLMGKELDACGADMITLLRNGLFFPKQIKSHARALVEHYQKYPYIHGTAIQPGADERKLMRDTRTFIHSRGKAFFSLQDCIPEELGELVRERAKRHKESRPQHPFLPILQKFSPLAASYHHALPRQEIEQLGADGVVFLRNGFGLFIQLAPGSLKTKMPALILPKSLANGEANAQRIAEVIEWCGRSFFTKDIRHEPAGVWAIPENLNDEPPA